MRKTFVAGVLILLAPIGHVYADQNSAARTVSALQAKIQEASSGGYVCQSVAQNAAAHFREILGMFQQGQQMEASGGYGSTYFDAAESQARAYLGQFRQAGC